MPSAMNRPYRPPAVTRPAAGADGRRASTRLALRPRPQGETAHFAIIFERATVRVCALFFGSSSEPHAAAARGVWRPRTGDCVRKPGLVRASGVVGTRGRRDPPPQTSRCGERPPTCRRARAGAREPPSAEPPQRPKPGPSRASPPEVPMFGRQRCERRGRPNRCGHKGNRAPRSPVVTALRQTCYDPEKRARGTRYANICSYDGTRTLAADTRPGTRDRPRRPGDVHRSGQGCRARVRTTDTAGPRAQAAVVGGGRAEHLRRVGLPLAGAVAQRVRAPRVEIAAELAGCLAELPGRAAVAARRCWRCCGSDRRRAAAASQGTMARAARKCASPAGGAFGTGDAPTHSLLDSQLNIFFGERHA